MTLSAQSLSVIRGTDEVLRGVDAAPPAGKITAIVGPNGAGKSSLLMALAGLLKPSGGAVMLDDTAVGDWPVQARAAAIGYLPQGADIAWDVSVEALVALGRMPHRDAHLDAGRAAIDDAIAALDLNEFRRRPVGRLSGGETARVLLARVLAGQPRWILADEPLAALDLAHQMRLIGHLKDCAQAGAGVVIVLHDLALAMNHADHVIVLDNGKTAASGAPSEALSADRIKAVWGVEAEWLAQDARASDTGQKFPGRYALFTSGPK